MSNVLVTGGAGYIGSHVVRRLGEAGHLVVVLDDLSNGFRDAVLLGELVIGDTGDTCLIKRVIESYEISVVIHLAAHTRVDESLEDPLKYYHNNTCKTRQLLEACVELGIDRFIYSSSAAVYGVPPGSKAAEDTPTNPINPYGMSKLVGEWIVRDTAAAHGFKQVTLRYFNVAGSDPQGRIGQCTPDATLLVKVACETALGKRPYMNIFGTDYPTPDGTAVRDYIHVEDLAYAHVKAVEYLALGGESVTLNCGYGHGYSVREVLDMARWISGTDFEVRETDRRAGDPPSLVAIADRIRTILEWRPRFDSLERIIQTSFEWEKKLLERSSTFQ